MTRLEQAVSFVVLGFGLVALAGGILGWNVSAVVLGCLLVLASLWFRRGITVMTALKRDTETIIEALGLIARVRYREHASTTGRPDDANHADSTADVAND